MEIDMRSEDPAELAKLDAQLKKALTDALAEENARWPSTREPITLKITDMGLRPASAPGDTTRIARTALTAGRALGFEPETGASSTDANIPMSLGIPAITMDGGGIGRGAHSLAESYDDGPEGWKGPQWVLLTTAMLAGVAKQAIVP
jgi:acetylornithine deacetylase/succinyl-diaminopimelate desuccinylase-like protein